VQSPAISIEKKLAGEITLHEGVSMKCKYFRSLWYLARNEMANSPCAACRAYEFSSIARHGMIIGITGDP
jgi:hypothetical protein